jgi:serine/threonine-protein kinase RsbW
MNATVDSDRPILVVEDDDATRQAECLLLEGRGYTVSAAANGREALERLREGLRPRVILLDLVMPILDGYAFRAEQLRDPELQDIPVVVCSAADDLGRRTASLRPAALLSKPFEFDRLAGAVGKLAGAEKPGVLVVDDDPQVCRLLELTLIREGFTVWSAPSGRAAVEFYRLHPERIGVVVLDVRMPELDGPQMLAALQRINSQVRALFVSGDTGDYDPEALVGMGAVGVLHKPFDLAKLSRAVREALVSRPPDRQGTVCLSIHATAELALVLDPITAVMERLGYPGRDLFGVRLALEEALVNAVKHGNQGDPSKQVRVRYRVTAEEVLAEVEDEGPGFDPTAVVSPLSPEGLERPSGRGLLLMYHYLSSVSYNERGNIVTLCKRRG